MVDASNESEPGPDPLGDLRPSPGPAPLGDLKTSEKKALEEFRTKLEEAIIANRLFKKPSRRRRRRHGHEKSKTRVANACSPDLYASEPDSGKDEDVKNISLWGIPLLPSKGHQGTDAVLLKFLRAREFRVSDAFRMLRKTLRWRREFGADEILFEDLELPELDGAAYTDGADKYGRPVCYNVYGVFRDEELYEKAFGNEERRERFVRWRIRFMEEGIKQLSFKQGGVGSMLQIIDVKDSLSHSMKELRSTAKKLVAILQDNYPEFVEKNIFLNASFRCYAYHALFSHFASPRSRSKFIFARPSKVTETLLKFIAPEDIPVQYGGFKREGDDEFSAENGRVSEIIVKGGSAGTIEIPIIEPGVTVVWDVSVVGWEVSYKEEFVPDDEGSYHVLVRTEKKLDESTRNSFYISEPGKVVLTIENRTFKKKRVLYRSKSKPTIPLYNLLNQTNHPIV